MQRRNIAQLLLISNEAVTQFLKVTARICIYHCGVLDYVRFTFTNKLTEFLIGLLCEMMSHARRRSTTTMGEESASVARILTLW